MQQKTIDKLFEENELWFNKEIHANLVTYIYGLLLTKLSEGIWGQDEYYVQEIIREFLHRKLTNTVFKSSREVPSFGQRRIDNSIVHKSSNEGLVYYEVKSFIKESEQSIQSKYVYKDIIKLALKKQVQPFCESYLLFAGRSEYIKNLIFTRGSIPLPHKYSDSKNKAAMKLHLNDFHRAEVDDVLINELKRNNIEIISISPSRFVDYQGISVFTWRINKV